MAERPEYCTNCGGRLDADDVFCGACGKMVIVVQPVASPQPTEPTPATPTAASVRPTPVTQQPSQQPRKRHPVLGFFGMILGLAAAYVIIDLFVLPADYQQLAPFVEEVRAEVETWLPDRGR